MLRITRAQLISKVCVRQTQAITPFLARGLKQAAIARRDDKDLETTSFSGRKFVPKFAQEEHVQIKWRHKPRSDPDVVLPRRSASLPAAEGYATLFSAPRNPGNNMDRETYKQFVDEARGNMHFLKIPKNIRPLIYRAKNEDVLEELNILYPNGENATTLPPRTGGITSGTIFQVIANATTKEELKVSREFLTDAVVYAPEAAKPAHLMELYNKYIELTDFSLAESMMRDSKLGYIHYESARVNTLRSKILYRIANPGAKGARDLVKDFRRVYRIDLTREGHAELPVELLFIAFLASTGLGQTYGSEIAGKCRKIKIEPDMTASQEGEFENSLRSRIMFKNYVANAAKTVEAAVAKGVEGVPQEALNDMYLDAKVTLDSLSKPTNDWNVDTQILGKHLTAYLNLLDRAGADKEAVNNKINMYANAKQVFGVTKEAKEAAEKVAAARNDADPTYSEEVVEGIHDQEPTVDGKTVQQLDAEEAEIGREAKANKASKAAASGTSGMSPEAKAAAEKVAAVRNDPEPTYSEEVVEGIHDQEPTVDGKTVKQLDAEEAQIARDAKAHPYTKAKDFEGMSPEAKAAAEKVAAVRNDPEPTYSEEVVEGIHDQEPTVDGKTVKQLDAEEAEIGREAKANQANKAAASNASGMSAEAKDAAEKVAAARNNADPTYSEEVVEGVYDKEPTVDGKTVEQLDAEEAKIGQEAKLRAEGKIPKE